MQKNNITNKITPCCGLPFSVIYWWVSNLTLNSEADRQYLLTQIAQSGVLSIDGWKVLVNSGTLEADASLTKAEFLAWFNCEKQPSCEQLKLIIEGYKMGSWVGDLNEIRFENVLGVLEISDPAPTTVGLYRLSEFGTYTNLGGIVTTAGKINDAYFNGTTWKLSDTELPNNVVNNLTSTSTTDSLSSNMGRVLNEDLKLLKNKEQLTEEITNSNYNLIATSFSSLFGNKEIEVRTQIEIISSIYLKPKTATANIYVFNKTTKKYRIGIILDNLTIDVFQTISIDEGIYLDVDEILMFNPMQVYYSISDGDGYEFVFDTNVFAENIVKIAYKVFYSNIDKKIFERSYENKIYEFTSFTQGLLLNQSAETNIKLLDTLSIAYSDVTESSNIKIPIKIGQKLKLYTKQGAFSPFAIVDKNNNVLDVFGDKLNYLENGFNYISKYNAYLVINAHDFIVSEKDKLKVEIGNSTINVNDYEEALIVVKAGGTPGVDCQYTDPRSALNSFTDNSYKKRYIVYVLDGDYDYSDNGTYGLQLKNYVRLIGQSFKTRIIKRDSTFDWSKATIDKVAGDLDYIEVNNMTVISNNCKCPIHIDSDSVKLGLFENLNLINEQPIGTGDNPADGEANCFALGWRKNDHIIVKNVKANGKIWGHNNYETNSKATFEIINCNARRIQIGEINSGGKDQLIIHGNNVDVFELLWFSELAPISGLQRSSYDFNFSGNNISDSIIKDHANTYDALEVYYKGKYPFSIAEIHKEMKGQGVINKGDKVSKVNNSTVKAWVSGETEFGIALENKDENGRLLVKI